MAAPECPYELAEAGASWWAWAWGTAQSAHWLKAGALYTVARRAVLEDERAILGAFEDFTELHDLLSGADDKEAVRRVEDALSTLKRSATGSVAMSKEMRELEAQVGLGPKAMAGLGWKAEEPQKDGLDDLSARRDARLAGRAASSR